MDATPEQLAALFPPPPLTPPVSYAPSKLAGITHESTETVLELLKTNHKKWHIFVNEMKFHNHTSHHLLAIYAMGANSITLRAAYDNDVTNRKPAIVPPGPIDESNWKDHLGDEKYYQSYLKFFSGLILSGSAEAVFESYIMSKDANLVPGNDGKAPLMLSRFLAAFLHSLIHLAYGFEFGLPGIIAEGLAQAAAHPTELVSLYAPELFEVPESPKSQSSSGVHALSILARIAKDDAFSQSTLKFSEDLFPKDGPAIERLIRLAGPKLMEYVNEWTVAADNKAIETKFVELVWMNTLMYAVGGWAGRKQSLRQKGDFNADFFLMHLVTSAVLMPSLLGALKPSSASLLLRIYFTASLVVYISRGRPPLPIADFYASTTATPSEPGPPPPATDKALPPIPAPNPWTQIVEAALAHPDEHFCKLQRALVHFATLYGGTPKGQFAGMSNDGLQGAEMLDGTLFVRAAGLSADRLGWVRQGEVNEFWDLGGFFRT